jgi:hypothetical protein
MMDLRMQGDMAEAKSEGRSRFTIQRKQDIEEGQVGLSRVE